MARIDVAGLFFTNRSARPAVFLLQEPQGGTAGGLPGGQARAGSGPSPQDPGPCCSKQSFLPNGGAPAHRPRLRTRACVLARASCLRLPFAAVTSRRDRASVSPSAVCRILSANPGKGILKPCAPYRAGSKFAFRFQYSSAIARNNPIGASRGWPSRRSGNHHHLLTLRHGTPVTCEIGSRPESAPIKFHFHRGPVADHVCSLLSVIGG